MTISIRFYLGLTLLAISSFLTTVSIAQASDNAAGIDNGVVVYYFHGNQRCVTCMNIEELSKASVEQKFAKGLKDGSVKFVSVNVDDDKNEHFIGDYQLLVRSVVIAKIKNGKEVGYRRLDKVWQLHNDPEEFMNYFNTEANTLLKGNK